MPYGWPPEGPKSGWRRTQGPPIASSHASFLGWTGRPETSACQTLLAGNTGQLGAAGGGRTAAGAVPVGGSESITRVASRARTVRILRGIGTSGGTDSAGV